MEKTMKKFVVSASVEGLFQPVFFSSRNAANRFAKSQFNWHGGSFFVNGRCKHTTAFSRKAETRWYFGG